MYFIILGHLFPPFDEYIYAFNVPLFFVLSGLLSKRDAGSFAFWKKICYSLIVPLLLICVINALFDSLVVYNSNIWNFELFYMRIIECLLGNGGSEYGGLRACWFVYTLILIKIIYQYLSKTWQLLLVGGICILLTLFVTRLGWAIWNAYANLWISYPFFLVGVFLKRYMHIFSILRMNSFMLFVFLIACLILCVTVKFNGHVWMYLTLYGKSYLLFWVSALAGICMVYVMSVIIGDVFRRTVTVLSTGMIVILGFHQIFLYFYSFVFDKHIWCEILYSVAVLIVFYPIILFCMKFFPVLIGKRVV